MFESEEMTEKDSHSISALAGKTHVLIVDDDEAIRKLLSKAFSLMGYDVALVGNGLEASTLFVTGSYDLVVTDFEMPLMNGSELSRIVKEKSPNTPVIVITGCCDNVMWEQMDKSCLDAIILKPFRLKEIEGTVRRLLGN